MSSLKMSENMRRVLCGLSYYPNDSLNMLAKKLSINTSTVSTSKQRIKERDLIRVKYIPTFFNVDMSSVVIISGKYRYQFPTDIRRSLMDFVTYPATPFFIIFDDKSWLIMSFLRTKEMNTGREQPILLSDNFLNEMTYDVNKVWFFSENTKVLRFFDYSYLFGKMYNIYLPPEKTTYQSLWSVEKLKKNEKKLFQNLIQKPGLSDFHRSQIIGISHPSITKMRKSLNNRGLIRKVIEPNLNAFDITIFSWNNIKLEEKNIDLNLIQSLSNFPNHILCIHDLDNIFILAINENLKDLLNEQKKIDELLTEAKISFEEINYNYFSIENSSFNIKLNPTPAFEILFGTVEFEEKQSALKDPERYLKEIMRDVLSVEDMTSIMSEIKYSFSSNGSSKDALEVIKSILLELLTKPKLLSSLEKKKRTILQGKLIENLNNIQVQLYNQERLECENNKKRVIIIEDSKDRVKLLNEMLKDSNFTIVGNADTCEGAFNLYKTLCEDQNKPDVVLIDSFIEGFNVHDTTRMIKDYDSSAYIVVLTSALDRNNRSEKNSIGIDEYLFRPVTKDYLNNALEKLVIKGTRPNK